MSSLYPYPPLVGKEIFKTTAKKGKKKTRTAPHPPAFIEPCDALSTDELFISDMICIRYSDISRMFRYDGSIKEADCYRVTLITFEDDTDDDEYEVPVRLALSRELYYALAVRWADYLKRNKK